MNAPALFHVFEHQTLMVGGAFTQKHFERLVQFGEQTQFRYFSAGYNRLKFNQFVGVLQVGNVTIEVLPKADRNAPADAETWQSVLLDMLQACHWIKPEAVTSARLAKRPFSLLDIFLHAFLHQVEVLVHRGLVKQYRQHQGNVFALKGQLKFAQHLSQNLIHQERFFTQHTVFDSDELLHQLLKEALNIVGNSASKSSIRAKAKALLLHFEHVSPLRYSPQLFENIRYTRKTEPYREALKWAELILGHQSPDLRSGQLPVLSFMFDMNALFEAYIFHQLKRAESIFSDFQVSRQVSKPFWRDQKIRPDVLIRMGEKRIILDTKWKITDKPSEDDLRQIYAYNLQFGADHGILLYPMSYSNTDENMAQTTIEHAFSASAIMPQHTHFCHLIFAPICTSNGQLNRALGQELAAQMLEMQKIRA
jgi:5-methylcytosine-specific restriction enzyme subunit McrC